MWKSLTRLTAIRNGSKRIISVSGWFWLLQMILELDAERCVGEDVGTHIGWRGE